MPTDCATDHVGLRYSINKDVVRRILTARYQPKPDSAGPSWLTVLGHAKDSLWSLDLFRCESAVLHTHWVLVVMDQGTRRIVRFGVHRGVVNGMALCQMFNRATRAPNRCRSISARTMIRCTGFISGRRTCGSSTSGSHQDGAVRAAFPSGRRTTDWDCPARMSRSDAVLDRRLNSREARRVPALIQSASHACGASRAPAGVESGRGRASGESLRVSVAGALSWPVSHAEGGVTQPIRSGLKIRHPQGRPATWRKSAGRPPRSATVACVPSGGLQPAGWWTVRGLRIRSSP